MLCFLFIFIVAAVAYYVYYTKRHAQVVKPYMFDPEGKVTADMMAASYPQYGMYHPGSPGPAMMPAGGVLAQPGMPGPAQQHLGPQQPAPGMPTAQGHSFNHHLAAPWCNGKAAGKGSVIAGKG